MTRHNFDLAPFEAWLSEKGRSEKTLSAYVSDLGVFAAFFEELCGEGFSSELVTSADLRKFQAHSQDSSPATWNRRLVSLNLFFRFCMETKLITFNPMERAGLRHRKQQKAAPRGLNRNDFARLMRTVEQDLNAAKTDNQRRLAIRNRALFGALAYGALRVSEACELRRTNLLLGERKGTIRVEHGKGDKRGDVALGREGRLMMQDWLEIHQEEDVFEGISTRQVERWLADVGQRAGVYVTPHMLRHTAIRRVFVSSGFDLALTQQFARHERGEQTQRYALPQEDEIAQVVELM